MATVYLARDLKHDRKVALKVLKPDLAAVLGADRFVVEIKTTAALQHPHILPLFDSGTAGGFLYYVMPYIEGETLRNKLNRETQLAVGESVKIAMAVADALDYAHRHGVIHRDIKPENILLHDGRPIVADFGIALAVSAAAGGRMTETGLSLGTPHYMSPEQATAEKEITGRSDIYSLGSVLYEMLTGEPPHMGNSAQQIIMKIVAETVQPVTRLRKSVPANVAAAVGKALEKLPADRFETANEFANALQDPAFKTTTVVTTTSGGFGAAWLSDRRTFVLLGLLIIAIAGPPLLRRSASGASRVEQVQFTFAPPAGYTFGTSAINFAVSPDGQVVAFPVRGEGATRLLVRHLSRLAAEPILTMPGLYLASAFSPNGRFVAVAGPSGILRVPVTGGAPVPVGQTNGYVSGLAWPVSDTILAWVGQRIWALSVQTGITTVLTTPDSGRGEVGHRTPVVVLPDGRWAFTVDTRSGLRPAALDPDRRTWTYLPGEVTGWLRGFAAGHLIVEQPTATLAVPVGKDGSPKGEPLVLEPAGVSVWAGPGGTLVAATRRRTARPEWVDRAGKRAPLPLEPQYYVWPRLSPDGRRLSIHRNPPGLVVDLITGRITTLPGPLGEGIWNPSGTYLTGRIAGERYLPAQQRPDGSAPPELIGGPGGGAVPTSWSPDGRFLLAYGRNATTAGDMDIVVRGPDGKWTNMVTSPGDQRAAMFSPDGRWVAYSSNESGRPEVYLRAWPPDSRQWIVSSGGGADPVWSRTGSELYFLAGDRVMVVTVQAGREPSISVPRERFAGPFLVQAAGDQSYDIAADGRLLMLFPADVGADQVKVTVNWTPATRP